MIIIFMLLAQGLLLKGSFEVYRFNHEHIYIYGKLVSNGLVYIAFFWSFLYPIIMWLRHRDIFKNNLILMIIAFLPALYFIVLSVLSK